MSQIPELLFLARRCLILAGIEHRRENPGPEFTAQEQATIRAAIENITSGAWGPEEFRMHVQAMRHSELASKLAASTPSRLDDPVTMGLARAVSEIRGLERLVTELGQ